MWIILIVYIVLVQLWVAGEKAQPSSGHMREKRPIMSFRGHEGLSYCIKSGRMSGMLVSGKTFPSPSKYCLTTLMTARFQISHETSDILLTCTWVFRGLDGSTCSESLLERTCDFEPPEHVPRTSARAHTCGVVFGRAPCVPQRREHEKRLAAGRGKKCRCAKKNTFIHRTI